MNKNYLITGLAATIFTSHAYSQTLSNLLNKSKTISVSNNGNKPSTGKSVSGNGEWNKIIFSAPEQLKGMSYSMTAGDFNNDGKTDLAFIGFASLGKGKGVYVALSNGDGTFKDPVMVEIGGDAGFGITSGYFDKDKTLDIVTANTGHGEDDGNLFLGKGDGTLRMAKPFPILVPDTYGHNISLIESADINGDGSLDILINTRGVCYKLGSSSGKFTGETEIKGISGDAGIAMADMDGNGSPDIITGRFGNEGAGAVMISLNTNGRISAPKSFNLTTGAYDLASIMAVGDLNGDKKPDVIVGFSADGGRFLNVFINKGDGTLQEPVKYKIAENGGSIGAVVVGDINGDKKLDVVAYQKDNALFVFPGNGDGTLGKTPIQLAAGGANFNTGVNLVLGDFKGNGMLGIAVKHLDPYGADWIDIINVTKKP